MTHRRGEPDPKKSWVSNANIAVYIFAVLFVTWISFQVWDRVGGEPSPPALDAMVMAALGVAITAKGKEVERKKEQKEKDSTGDET